MTEITLLSNPTPSAVPNPNERQNTQTQETKHDDTPPDPEFPKPKYRLHVEDLRHPASSPFNAEFAQLAAVLDNALKQIIQYLYTPPHVSKSDPEPKGQRPYFHPSIPPTRSVTIILRDFDGVAYTTGTDIDNDHKEIHVSLKYLHSLDIHKSRTSDPVREITGFLTHELVHCYQHTAPVDDGSGKTIPQPPGGLIEGIADFVRLKAGLQATHWKKPQSSEQRAAKWDAGYQNTAFFLAWIEDVWVGKGAIGMLNDRLLRTGYIGEGDDKDLDSGEPGFWVGLFGIGVDDLWDEYGRYLDSPSTAAEGHKDKHHA
ncbi:hypothetical protein N7468_002474 [Penicillium chermesinum]|uniref:PBSP domain protein n=1 Tax=Penicillium chermesinum TaxID=63820 RepID=A0A9W9TXK4_9EURO|nr:uncharacterized protein N7468_002474 [Penicillium chermesinum]KAJ5247491.1 hypothetical protein N7468_002474 [Penicillium chermesinum]KAJ6145730.1 hypothetical protein N7470_009625 [Penicillium chermesinum]